jgi:hypothetical protein
MCGSVGAGDVRSEDEPAVEPNDAQRHVLLLVPAEVHADRSAAFTAITVVPIVSAARSAAYASNDGPKSGSEPLMARSKGCGPRRDSF